MSIKTHVWHDTDIDGAEFNTTGLALEFKKRIYNVLLNKEDAIAIAKHFGIIES